MKIKINKDYYIYLFFLIIFIIGLRSYQDFGIYGDEPFHRWIGSIYYSHYKEIIFNFNFNNEYIAEIDRLSKDKYFRFWVVYPVFFDLLSEFIIDIFNVDSSKGVFQTRHLINFLIFFSSLIFFYKLILTRFKNYYLALLGVIFIFLSPRIFAESFYNSKDILFLSFSIINIYFSLKFMESQGNKNLILYSISTSLLIQSRIMGLIFPLLTFSFILFEFIENRKILIEKLSKITFSFFIICLMSLLFWPFLWNNFIESFSFYLKYIQHLAGAYTNLYFGETILSNHTPWHFKYVWIFITIPLSILFLSIFGLIINFIKFLNRVFLLDKNNKIWFDKKEALDFLVLLLLIFPLIAILKFKNNFDGWRHLYYVYPFLIYHSIFLINKVKLYNFKLFVVLNFLIIINIFFNSYWMLKYHPFQYTYFNSIHKNFNKSFDLDYMGLSVKNSLEYILKKDERSNIKIAGVGAIWIKGNTLILDKNSQQRLEVVNYEESDYIIDTFRPHVGKKMIIDPEKFSKFYDLVVDDRILNRIYKKN
jgi:hypothetical protein